MVEIGIVFAVDLHLASLFGIIVPIMSKSLDKNFLESALSEDAIMAIIEEEEKLAKEHARQAEGWRLILRGRQYLGGRVAQAVLPGVTEERRDRPTNFDAVLRVVASDPTRTWTPELIMDGLEERGWTFRGETPRKTLGAVLSILVQKKQLRRPERGKYKLPLDLTEISQVEIPMGDRR